MADIDSLQNTIQEILQRITRVEAKIDNTNKVIDNYNGLREKTEVHAEKIENIDKRVTKMENSNVWLWRTITAAIIVSFIGAFLVWKV